MDRRWLIALAIAIAPWIAFASRRFMTIDGYRRPTPLQTDPRAPAMPPVVGETVDVLLALTSRSPKP